MSLSLAGWWKVLAAGGLLSGLSGWQATALAADHAAVARGEDLAQLVCSTCHEQTREVAQYILSLRSH